MWSEAVRGHFTRLTRDRGQCSGRCLEADPQTGGETPRKCAGLRRRAAGESKEGE